MSDQAQADFLADKFSSISLEYEKIKYEDILIPPFDKEDIPLFTPESGLPYLQKIKVNNI